ncbi:class I SAM-dependent methyltransferase [Arcticibacter eurypsychrophilus]|uniref:class I SAM-dependent methyltransferase n=1 Tax=Arcticibacter eurypsychrophilus TaxID=1434752 RepID=UPI00084D894C|nr:class I SAM-dependent methyltransferase [Arcticibacter eurypsychrophilus]
MNQVILQNDVQNYIKRNLTADITKIMLAKSPFKDVSSKELAEQIDSKHRAEKKLPTWFHADQIYYPSKLAVEQTSSEATASYKSQLIKGNHILDLTGGFGVDSYFFSKVAQQVIYCEQNKELAEIAKYNLTTLGLINVDFFNEDGLTFLQKSTKIFDTVYIDPSRRVENKKVFMLQDTEPNVIENLPLLLEKTHQLVIKTSPMLDLQAGLKEFGAYVREIHVVSYKNDCKELLWVLQPEICTRPQIHCAMLSTQKTLLFNFYIESEKNSEILNYSDPLSYLYEPDVAILKAGAFKSTAIKYGVQKLNINTHLYTADSVVNDFPGKTFKVISAIPYKDFIKKKIKGSFNVISRNFPLTPEQLKKKHKLSDGGEVFLLFTTGCSGNLVTIEAERLVKS